MLSKRDKLILRIASKMGLYRDDMGPTLEQAKKSAPGKPIDRLMRDLKLIDRTQHRALAKKFNEKVKIAQTRKGSGSSRRKQVVAESEQTYVMPGVTPNKAGGSSIETEHTTVMGGQAPLPEFEGTIVLGAEALVDKAPVGEADRTFVMPENRNQTSSPASPAEPEFEGTIVLGAESKVRSEPESIETERTMVIGEAAAPRRSRQSSRRIAVPDPDNTLVISDNLISESGVSESSGHEEALEYEQTFVLRDETNPRRNQTEVITPASAHPVVEATPAAPAGSLGGPDDIEFEQTLVLSDKPPQTPNYPPVVEARPAAMPPVVEAMPMNQPPPVVEARPAQAYQPAPIEARPAAPSTPATEWENTMVLREDDSDDALLTMPDDDALDDNIEFEQTLVLSEGADPRRNQTEVLRPAAPVVEATPAAPMSTPGGPADIEFEQTLVLNDSDDSTQPLPALLPDEDELIASPTLVIPDEDDLPTLDIPLDMGGDMGGDIESENTMVLSDNAGGGSAFSSFNQGAELTLADDSGEVQRPVVRLDMPEGMNPVIEATPVQKFPVPGQQAKSDKKSDSHFELKLGDLNLASESGVRQGAALEDKPGPLTRDVFKRLAKQRKSFSGYSIDDYEVSGEISRGAMGVVLRATPVGLAKTMAQQRGFEGDVALKVMLENQQDPKEAERFVAEMKILTKLNHPNIVSIFDSGREGGLTYFSMELLEGEDIREMVRKSGPPPIMLTLRIIAEVANALAFLHKKTVYHRDLKPQNVIFNKRVKPFRAVLIDFGLVTDHGDEGDKGLILGTPQYMPPEQASPRGGFGIINATSDIYSLGATLYYMLTGRPPFIGRDPRKIIKRVVSEAVKDPAELNPDVPRRVADICLKCLEKQQRDRYTAARLLAADLEKELKSSQRLLKAKSLFNRFWNTK